MLPGWKTGGGGEGSREGKSVLLVSSLTVLARASTYQSQSLILDSSGRHRAFSIAPCLARLNPRDGQSRPRGTSHPPMAS
jgi:hypothetical protein